MNLIKKALKYAFVLLLLPLAVVLLIDAVFGDGIANGMRVKEEQQARMRSEIDRQYSVGHPIYHHDLAPNYRGDAYWSDSKHQLCTDGSGFKSDCNSELKITKSYDVAFIGDSVTEGVGLPYPKTFVGLVATAWRSKTIANLGVVSYSPSIYYSKLKYLLDAGYTFKEVIVFIDISDVQDEGVFYILDGDQVKSRNPESDPNIFENSNLDENWFLKSMNIRFCTDDWFPLLCKSYNDYQYKLAKLKEYYSADYPRSAWTYNINSNGYGNAGVPGAISSSTESMRLLYEMLNARGIKLSVGVYPWPAQLLFDREDSEHVRIWSEFCQGKCTNFYNAFPFFFERVQEIGVDAVMKEYYIPGDVHFSENGNRAISEVILKTKPMD